MWRILVINGPNLNMLGIRNKSIYGNMTLEDINRVIEKEAYKQNICIECFQSNVEGELVNKIQQAYEKYDGIIINPGAYSHYSIAIRDAIEAVAIPCVEVHISNIYAREEFRHSSVISPVCIGQISGFKHLGYILALSGLTNYLKGVIKDE